MKFNFKVQPYQTDAVDSVIKVFKGQKFNERLSYIRDLGKAQKKVTQLKLGIEDEFGESLDVFDDTGFKNQDIDLSNQQLLKNIHDLQLLNNIKLSPTLFNDLGRCSLDIEMETGERVIIVTGCINVLVSRVSGTLTKYNSCIA